MLNEKKNKKTSTKLSKFTEYKDKITDLLSRYNISLDVESLLKNIEITDKTYADVLDTFLLKYSDQYKVLTALYNKEYPYDLELNRKVVSFTDVLYDVENENFYGVKFSKYNRKNIINYITTNNILVKGLLVDIKYDIDYFLTFLSKLKLDLELKYITDNISNVYIVLNQQTSPLINKIALYEVYKKLKHPKEITQSFIQTKDNKISIINNKLLERFYYNFSVSDVSFCIREYLDRNGFLNYFSTFCVDCIAYILYIQNKKSTNYLRDFLKFRFTGYTLTNCSEVSNNTDINILVCLDNLKYTARYPPSEILNRLKYLNKEVYAKYFTNVETSYFSTKNINSKLCFTNYRDYDVVLSRLHINGSKMISYKDTEFSKEFFNYADKRAYMFYSKSTHTLMIKFKEEVNREMFYMYLISSCKFNYILINQ